MRMKHYFTSCCLLPLLLWTCTVSAEVGKKQQGPLLSEPVGAGDYLQMLFGLLLVVGVIFGMAWLVRRMGSFQQVSHGALRILGGLSVGQRERIVLVQVGDRQILIGLAPGQIRTLHVLDKSVSIHETKTDSGISFAERLQAVVQGKVKR